MNMLENKRVIALSAVFAVAFAGLAYYGYSRGGDFSATRQQLEEINTRFLDYEAADPPPTQASLEAVKKAGDVVTRQVGELQATLARYAASCNGNGKVITPVEFQNQVHSAIDEVHRRAAEKGCNIATPAADLGMTSYKSAAARDTDVPYLHFQLRAARRVAEIVIDSGSPSLEKVYCAALPEELINSKKKLEYIPLNIEVAFNARRSENTDGKTPESMSVLPQALNKLASDPEFFYAITGVAVNSTAANLPPVDAYVAPTAPATAGDDLTADGEAEAKPDAPVRTIAVRKTGDPNETARVHLTLQVLYFNPNPTKGK